MAATFPLNTAEPWTWNGVTYEYDATEDRWFVVSTAATDSVVKGINSNQNDIDVLSTVIDQEIENRNNLLDVAASKNNQQDADIAELDQRVDAIGQAVGALSFKGRYTFVLEKSDAACQAIQVQCIIDAGGDVTAIRNCQLDYDACVNDIDAAYPDGSFTTVGTNVIASVDEIIISEKDLDGLAFDWLNLVDVDDYIELFEINNNDTALYQVIEEPQATSAARTIRIKFLKQTGQGDGNFNLQEEYELRVIKASQGLDIIAADERYIQKPYSVYFEDNAVDISPIAPDGNLKNGELWYDTDSLELFIYNNNAWTASARPPTSDITIKGIINDVDTLIQEAYITSQRLNTVISESLLENNIYYSDTPPVGDITGTLRNGDLWIDSDDLEIKFYSMGAWINPDRQVGGDYLEKSGGEMSGKLVLKKPRGDNASNNLVIWGRINGSETVLLKDYQRQNSQSTQDDYILYYGDTPSGYGLMNRSYADNRYIMADGDDMRGKLTLGRLPNGANGFEVRGRNQDGDVDKLLSVYHNVDPTPDAINYFGKVDSDNNIQNKASVEALIRSTPINTLVYVAENGLWDGDDWQNPTNDGKFSASGDLSNGNHFWYFSDIDQNGNMLNLREFSSSDKETLYIQIGHYSHTYLNDPNVNRDGMKIVWAGMVEQATRVTTGPLGSRVNTSGWELFLNSGTGDNSIPGGTITSGGTYYIKFGGLL